MRIGKFRLPPLMLLLVFVPAAGVAELVHAPATWVFAMSALGIVPLAGLMGRATEHLSERMGPGLGGLLNASFGNAAELIIALVALQRGLHDVVKASITGSIIGNILLVLGLAIVAGGSRVDRLRFNATAAATGGTLLMLSAIGLVVPAVYHQIVKSQAGQERELSLEIAIVLFATYLLNLVFSLRTHKHLYAGQPGPTVETTGAAHGTAAHPPEAQDATLHPTWGIGRSVAALLVAAVLVAVMSELLVGAVEQTAAALGMTEIFVGVILVAIVGNAAEHSTAVLVARKNQMDLAFHIAVGSSIQIALFVAPVLVFTGYLLHQPLDLLFTPFEVLAVVASAAILNLVAQDGETNWLEGVQLLAVYVILALAFFSLP